MFLFDSITDQFRYNSHRRDVSSKDTMASENVNNLKQVAQENEENPYECKICSKRFSHVGKLNHHTRSE